MKPRSVALKRGIDVILSMLALIGLSPAFAILSVLIKLDSRGPVIHRRRVSGLCGKTFDAFKFRTMIVNADQWLRQHPALWKEYQENIKLRDDPRITRVGRWLRKYSLDELPQLINVLRGEMSMVGPRIITPDELTKYGEFAEKRLSVKPGITGLWQVSGRQDVSYEKRILLDIEYIDNWFLWFDIKILIKTIGVVLGAKGAY